MRDKDWARLAFLILILVFILSCGISFNMGNDSGNTDLAIEQTMQVIRQTQTADCAGCAAAYPGRTAARG